MLGALIVTFAYVSVRRTQQNGYSRTEPQKSCQELAPGVNYCQDIGIKGVDQIIDVKYKTPPLNPSCRKGHKAKLKPMPSVLLLHHVGSWASANDPEEFTPFFTYDDFTVANATKMGIDTLKAWDMAVDGLCEGERVEITLPPSLGFDEPGARVSRPEDVPEGSMLRFDVEIIKVLIIAADGHPYRPCFFSLMDTDDSGDLDELELARHFARVKQQMPQHVMNEDTDGDGRISFDEFTGPKIPKETQEQLLLKEEL